VHAYVTVLSLNLSIFESRRIDSINACTFCDKAQHTVKEISSSLHIILHLRFYIEFPETSTVFICTTIKRVLVSNNWNNGQRAQSFGCSLPEIMLLVAYLCPHPHSSDMTFIRSHTRTITVTFNSAL
jgi:hypothetical protein